MLGWGITGPNKNDPSPTLPLAYGQREGAW